MPSLVSLESIREEGNRYSLKRFFFNLKKLFLILVYQNDRKILKKLIKKFKFLKNTVSIVLPNTSLIIQITSSIPFSFESIAFSF
jgi:hypothetical protein